MPEPSTVGSTAIAEAFFAGRYANVLAQTIDSARGGCDDEDTAFVIGALAFAGRIVEAELLLEGARARPRYGARTLAASAFFVSIAYCRTGRLEEGRRVVLRGVRDTAGARDGWSRALLFQAIAGCRFFAADYVRAGRAATRALASAQLAQFPYAQLLANDMRGHVLLRLGKMHEGVVVLERARTQALNLGFTTNAHAIEISIHLQRAAVSTFEEGARELESLLGREAAQDSYSRRSVLLELATQLALLGRRSAALTLLDAAAPLCAGDARAEASLLCARAQCARIGSGWPAARALATRAAAILPPGIDPSREVEILAILLGAAVAEGDDEAEQGVSDRLRMIARETGLYRADAWLHVYGRPTSDLAFTLAEADRAMALLQRVATRGPTAALDAQLLGLLPEASGLTPGQRLHVRDDALVVEDHGDVARLPPLAPRTRDVLCALARGAHDREALLAEVWGIRSYRPERHDSVIKTTVSRLRSALAERAAWLETDQGSYRLRRDVELVLPSRSAPVAHEAAAPEGDESPASRAAVRRAARVRKLLSVLARLEEATVSELAREIGTSVRTMSRDLSELHAARAVVRAGSGPATRYRIAGPDEHRGRP